MSRMPQIPAVHEAASAVAEDLEKTGMAIGESQVAQHRSKGVPGWVGVSADAYTDSIVRLGSYARNFAHAFIEPSKQLSTWAEEVKTTRKKIDDLHEREKEAVLEYEKTTYALREWVAAQELLGVQVAPEVIQSRIVMIESKYQATLDGLFREYDSLIAKLTETAGVAAKALQSSMDALVPPGKRSSRCEIGANLFNGIDVVDGQAEQERAQEIASAIASRMQDRDFTPEDLEEFHKKYGEELSNPFVARALAEHIGPREMSEFAVRVTAVGAKGKVRDDVLKQLGTSMVLASGGSNYSEEAAEYQRKFEVVADGLRTDRGDSMAKHAADYANRLKSAGHSSIKVDAIASAPQNKEVEGYSIISQLLGKAGESNPDLALGPEFFEQRDGLPSTAQDLVAWNAEQSNSTWRTQYRFDNIPSLFKGDGDNRHLIDPIHSMMTLMDQPDALKSEGALGIPKSFGPGVEEEELRRKDAVKSFLAGDTPQGMDVDGDGNADEPMNMTRYLTGGRLGYDYYGFQDGGEQFGKVIAEASAVEEYPGGAVSSEAMRDWMSRDEQATRIAANFMFGYQDGLDVENPLDEGQDPFGKNNKALRSWAGLILGPHLEGFASSLDHETQSNDVRLSTDAKRHWVTTSAEMRERLLGKNGFFIDLGFDKPEVHDNNTPDDPTDDYYLGQNGRAGRAPALANMILQAGAEYGRDVHDIISGRSEESLAQVGGRWAPLLDALFTAPSGASEQAIEEMNERNRMWRSLFNKAMDVVPSGDLAKVVAPGALKLATYAIDQVKGVGAISLDSLFPIAETNNVDLVRESEMVKTYMHNAVYDSLSAQERLYSLPMTPAQFNVEITDVKEKFVDQAGRVIPYSAMTPKQRDNFKSYIAQHLPEFGADDGLQDVETAANNARKANENARIRSEG